MTADKARKRAIRARMAATGEPYSVAARALQVEAPERRTATATATYTPGRGWRLSVDDPSYPDSRGAHPFWSGGRAHHHRDTLIEQAARELGAHGWDIAAPPAADPVPDLIALPLRRNDLGLRQDEVNAIHAAAGVTYHTAHHAYVEAVALAVASTGIPIYDIGADTDEPRGGGFRIGDEDELEWDDDTGYGPALQITWRETLGWYEVYFSDAQAALGDYAKDLPGDLGKVALPQDVAAAVADIVESRWPTTTPEPWTPPPGYDPDPPLPADDGWDVSPALERSLVAYATRPAS